MFLLHKHNLPPEESSNFLSTKPNCG